MIVEASEVPPAGIAADFDQTRSENDAKDQPAEQPDHELGRRAFWKGPAIQQRTEKDREKAGLQKLDLPAISIPVLSDREEREVKPPEQRHQ